MDSNQHIQSSLVIPRPATTRIQINIYSQVLLFHAPLQHGFKSTYTVKSCYSTPCYNMDSNQHIQSSLVIPRPATTRIQINIYSQVLLFHAPLQHGFKSTYTVKSCYSTPCYNTDSNQHIQSSLVIPRPATTWIQINIYSQVLLFHALLQHGFKSTYTVKSCYSTPSYNMDSNQHIQSSLVIPRPATTWIQINIYSQVLLFHAPLQHGFKSTYTVKSCYSTPRYNMDSNQHIQSSLVIPRPATTWIQINIYSQVLLFHAPLQHGFKSTYTVKSCYSTPRYNTDSNQHIQSSLVIPRPATTWIQINIYSQVLLFHALLQHGFKSTYTVKSCYSTPCYNTDSNQHIQSSLVIPRPATTWIQINIYSQVLLFHALLQHGFKSTYTVKSCYSTPCYNTDSNQHIQSSLVIPRPATTRIHRSVVCFALPPASIADAGFSGL